MIRILGALLLLVPFAAFGQIPTCPAASTVTPQPWNESRVGWQAPTTYATTPPQPIPANTALTYTVLRRTGTTGTFAAVCQVTSTASALATALSNQPNGQNFYTVTARTATGPSSTQPPPADKTIGEPPVSEPTNITVASTRIGPDSFTCRDSAGNVLTRHERQDKAQESCTNLAIASVGTPYDVIPSGYRIVARAR